MPEIRFSLEASVRRLDPLHCIVAAVASPDHGNLVALLQKLAQMRLDAETGRHVGEDQGVALASRVLVEGDLRAARLVALFEGVDYGDMRAGYYLVHRPGPMREPLRQFVRWLRRAAKADLAESRA